ncbi:MAG: acyl-CoA dehydrogenase family protein, partial [Bacteroidota bacterium]
PGLKVVRNISVMGERGSDYASHSEIIFDNCRVPTSHLLGAEGAGFVISLERLIYGRIHHCMRWIGICERAFDLMCRRAISRKTSDKEVLADSDLIRTWIAECRIEINATRALVLSVADKIDRQGVYASQEDVSIIKVHTANVLQKVLDHAIQLHGALGMTDDTPLAYWYRHERAAKIYDGPDEIHKKAIAKSSLRKYGFPARRKEAVATNAVENGI